jgi:hypothetical protein
MYNGYVYVVAGKHISQARLAGSIWQGAYCLVVMGSDSSDSGEYRRAASAGGMLQSLDKPEDKAGLLSRPFARRQGLVLGTSVHKHAQSIVMAML